MHQLPISVINALFSSALDPKIYRAHPQLMVCVKFHDDGCKNKGIMRKLLFSVINAF